MIEVDDEMMIDFFVFERMVDLLEEDEIVPQKVIADLREKN